MCMRRYRYENRAAAPVLRDQFVFRQLLFYTLDICIRLIYFVDCYYDFDSGCFCMVDCFDCLRHDTVICCDYQYRNIRRISAAHTHSRKCLMTRCIQKRNVFTVAFHHICTDCLCNAAGLLVCHSRISDRIQQGGLAVVYMAHNTYYRRTCRHLAFVLFAFF